MCVRRSRLRMKLNPTGPQPPRRLGLHTPTPTSPVVFPTQISTHYDLLIGALADVSVAATVELSWVPAVTTMALVMPDICLDMCIDMCTAMTTATVSYCPSVARVYCCRWGSAIGWFRLIHRCGTTDCCPIESRSTDPLLHRAMGWRVAG